MHICNGLLSFEVELGQCISVKEKARDYLRNTQNADSFLNEVFQFSLHHDSTIEQTIDILIKKYNTAGQNILMFIIDALDFHKGDTRYLETLIMRAKFALNEAFDYHRLTGRYKPSGEVSFDLEKQLISGHLRPTFDKTMTLETFKQHLKNSDGFVPLGTPQQMKGARPNKDEQMRLAPC